MLEKLIPWIGGIFATIGLICLLFDLIGSIRKHNRRALNIFGLIVLLISVGGYLITDVVLKDSAWPPQASFVWIALFWVYVILTAVGTVGDVKAYEENRWEREEKKRQEAKQAKIAAIKAQKAKEKAKIAETRAKQKAKEKEIRAKEMAKKQERKAKLKARKEAERNKKKASKNPHVDEKKQHGVGKNQQNGQ